MDYLAVFAERLKDLRQEKILTIRELEKETGVSRNSISTWENGKSEPKMLAIIALAKFFDVSTDYLLGLSDN